MTQALLGELRGEPPVDRQPPGRRPAGAVAGGRGHPRACVSADLNPLIIVRRRPHRRRRPGGAGPGRDGDRAHRAVPGPVRPSRGGGGRRVEPPGQVRVRGPAQHPRQRVPGHVFATNRDGRPVLGIDTVPTSTTSPRASADLVFVCTPPATNPTCCGRPRPRASAPPSWPPPATARPATEGAPGPGRAGGAGRRAGRAHRRAQRPGPHVHPARRCAPRSSAPYPPAGRIGMASQSGNFVSSFMNYACASRRGHQPGGVGRQLRHGGRRPTSWPSTPAIRPPTWPWPTWRASPDGRRFFEEIRAVAEQLPVVLVKGGATSGGQRAAAPHRVAGHRRPRLRRHVPPGRGHPGRHHRGGLRGGRHLRHPAEPAGNRVAVVTTAGGWGSSPPTPSPAPRSSWWRCRRPASPPWTPSSRPAGAATTRSTWPAARPATPITAVLEIVARIPASTPWSAGHGHPVQHRPPAARGPVRRRHGLARDRRLPRAPGPPLRRRRCRVSVLHREAGAGGHRARRHRPRQRRPAAARDGPALLPVGGPGRDRPRPPLERARWRQRRASDRPLVSPGRPRPCRPATGGHYR